MLFIVKNVIEKDQKRLCIIRYGAWGDAIMLSPVFKYYSAQNWHITLNCTEKCHTILKTNPYIDAFIIQESNEIPIDKLPEHWKKLEGQFDKVVNFSGSIEDCLLISPQRKEYIWSKEKLEKKCNKNYYDHTMEWAGFPEKKGEIGELHFTTSEEKWAKRFRKKHKGFLVLWCLSGSSIHKIYPYADSVIQAIIEGIPEATVVLVGEPGAKHIIDSHPRIVDMCGEMGIRKSFILTKYVDLVISPETSVLAAAGCFDTDKIALLSHGSEENVTKYYKCCTVVRQDVSCSPCHRLHYDRDSCPVVEETQFPVCMGLLHPKLLLPPIEQSYKKFKEIRNG